MPVKLCLYSKCAFQDQLAKLSKVTIGREYIYFFKTLFEHLYNLEMSGMIAHSYIRNKEALKPENVEHSISEKQLMICLA